MECFCSKETRDSFPWEMSASARFFVFLLWLVKMEGLFLEGRVRAAVEVGLLEEEDSARREASCEEKARVDDEVISLLREFFCRGIP